MIQMIIGRAKKMLFTTLVCLVLMTVFCMINGKESKASVLGVTPVIGGEAKVCSTPTPQSDFMSKKSVLFRRRLCQVRRLVDRHLRAKKILVLCPCHMVI